MPCSTRGIDRRMPIAIIESASRAEERVIEADLLTVVSKAAALGVQSAGYHRHRGSGERGSYSKSRARSSCTEGLWERRVYKYQDIDREIVFDRVAEFRDQVARRLNGELSEAQFLPLRLMNGPSIFNVTHICCGSRFLMG